MDANDVVDGAMHDDVHCQVLGERLHGLREAVEKVKLSAVGMMRSLLLHDLEWMMLADDDFVEQNVFDADAAVLQLNWSPAHS